MADQKGKRDAVRLTVWAVVLVLLIGLLVVYFAMRPGPEQSRDEEAFRQQEDVVTEPLIDEEAPNPDAADEPARLE
jgi:cbb3-type cytochrome oxidase subunit 3